MNSPNFKIIFSITHYITFACKKLVLESGMKELWLELGTLQMFSTLNAQFNQLTKQLSYFFGKEGASIIKSTTTEVKKQMLMVERLKTT